MGDNPITTAHHERMRRSLFDVIRDGTSSLPEPEPERAASEAPAVVIMGLYHPLGHILVLTHVVTFTLAVFALAVVLVLVRLGVL